MKFCVNARVYPSLLLSTEFISVRYTSKSRTCAAAESACSDNVFNICDKLVDPLEDLGSLYQLFLLAASGGVCVGYDEVSQRSMDPYPDVGFWGDPYATEFEFRECSTSGASALVIVCLILRIADVTLFCRAALSFTTHKHIVLWLLPL